MIKKYFKLTLAIIKNNLMVLMEYRMRFLISIFTAAFWVVFQLAVVEIFFQYTNNLFGWSKQEIFLFTGFFRVIKSIFDIFIRTNLFEFSELINEGMFDFVLIKPANTLFLSSFRKHKYEDIPGIFIGGYIIYYALATMGITVDFTILIRIIVVILTGLLMYYLIFLFFSTLSIFMTRVTAMSDINNVFANSLRNPTSVMSRNNFIADLLLLPMAVTLTFPVMLFLERGNFLLFLIEAIFLTLVLFGVTKFWNFALKHYSSASS